jgi:transcriptional antiterminator NusG
MHKPFSPQWYAAFVETGEEDNVKARLEYRLSDCLTFYVPKRKLKERKDGKWHDIIRTLFPGYVLINGRMGIEEYKKFKDIPGLHTILKSNMEPLTIPKDEIEMLDILMSDGEIIGTSQITINDGQRVKVLSGPLAKLEGNVISINKRKGRAKVEIVFLKEKRVFELAVEVLEKE